MGNNKSTNLSPLEQRWGKDNLQTFMVKGHKNKIFGCDVIIPNKSNNNELWIASCSADGRLNIHEVLIETSEEKHNREKILNHHKLHSKSKSLSSIQVLHHEKLSKTNKHQRRRSSKFKLGGNTNNDTPKPFEIEINRLLSIPLDSTYCYTLSLHPNCHHVSTAINKSLFIFDIDFNADSPIYHEIKLAKKYISGAQFIDDQHIIFCSGDGNVYIYNFIERKLISTIKYIENVDILCMDYGELTVLNGMKSYKLIAFATNDGNILIYDISDVITKDFNLASVGSFSNLAGLSEEFEEIENTEFDNDLKVDNSSLFGEKKVDIDGKCVLIQTLTAQFGAEISCLSLTDDGKFLCVGSEDNTYNMYGISLQERDNSKDGMVDIKWVLLCKQIIRNDASINHVSWINNNTMISSCNKGSKLYLSGIYDIRDSKIIIDLLTNIFYQSIADDVNNNKNDGNMVKIVYVGKNGKEKEIKSNKKNKKVDNELNIIINNMIDIILDYVTYYVLHSSMSVDFNDHISCIATCPKVNNGAGFIVVGGFAKLLQCFLPLQ